MSDDTAEVMHEGMRGEREIRAWGKSLYLPLDFIVNLLLFFF